MLPDGPYSLAVRVLIMKDVMVAAYRRNLVPSLACLVVLAALAVGGIAAVGISNADLPLKAIVAVIICIVAGVLTYYRPALVPFAAYAAMVPFDNLLQTGSGTVTKFLGLLALAMLLCVYVDRRFTVSAPLAVAGWSVYLLWNIASFLWSADPFFDHVQLLAQTIELFALYAVFSMLRISPSHVRTLLVATVAGAVACAGYGIVLFRTGAAVADSEASSRLSITFGSHSYINADHFSAALLVPVALAMVAAIHMSGFKKVLAGAALVVLLAGIYVSGTRGSLIAVGFELVYLMITYKHRIQLMILGAVGLLASLPFSNIWARFSDPSQGDAGGRIGIWGIAWEAFKHNWLLGVGTEQFRIAYSNFYLTSRSPMSMHAWAEDPHNLIVSNAVELGIIGVVLVLGAWFIQWRVGSWIGRGSSLFDSRIALEAGILGLFVNAMSLDIMFYKYLWLAFTLAVLVRNAALTEARPLVSEDPASGSAEPRATVVPEPRLTASPLPS